VRISASRVLAAFAFYAAALDLGFARGFVMSVASPAGLVLLAAAGVLLGFGAYQAARAPGPLAPRLARMLASGGAALALVAIPASLATRDTRQLQVGEGQELGPGPGVPPLRFGNVALAPRGPHVLSKTVDVEVFPRGGRPLEVGLFPPHALGAWRATVTRFGYALGVHWAEAGGAPLAEGYVMLGTLPRREEDAALVTFTPTPNVMMGAGTFPPALEDLLSPEHADAHLFLRLDEATIAGERRDLRDPDAYRWLVDGRLEDPVVFAQVFRGEEKVFEGKVRAGDAVTFAGGSLALERDVLLWVDLLAVRDPFLAWAVAGLGLLAAGLLLRVALAAGALVARRRSAPDAA
jgi:hypothetical protein